MVERTSWSQHLKNSDSSELHMSGSVPWHHPLTYSLILRHPSNAVNWGCQYYSQSRHMEVGHFLCCYQKQPTLRLPTTTHESFQNTEIHCQTVCSFIDPHSTNESFTLTVQSKCMCTFQHLSLDQFDSSVISSCSTSSSESTPKLVEWQDLQQEKPGLSLHPIVRSAIESSHMIHVSATTSVSSVVRGIS